MIKIIRERSIEEIISYDRNFAYENRGTGGFSFPSDEHGNVDLEKLQPAAQASYAACLAGEIEVVRGQQWEYDADDEYVPVPGTGIRCLERIVDLGVCKSIHHYTHCRIGECHCGAEVALEGFTNTCDNCGRDYNMSGQLLANRSQWGEETGESLSDILRIP